jgi:hypothetical protein
VSQYPLCADSDAGLGIQHRRAIVSSFRRSTRSKCFCLMYVSTLIDGTGMPSPSITFNNVRRACLLLVNIKQDRAVLVGNSHWVDLSLHGRIKLNRFRDRRL